MVGVETVDDGEKGIFGISHHSNPNLITQPFTFSVQRGRKPTCNTKVTRMPKSALQVSPANRLRWASNHALTRDLSKAKAKWSTHLPPARLGPASYLLRDGDLCVLIFSSCKRRPHSTRPPFSPTYSRRRPSPRSSLASGIKKTQNSLQY